MARLLFVILLLMVRKEAQAFDPSNWTPGSPVVEEWVEGVNFEEYLGKTIIVGFDLLRSDGRQYGQHQFWGKIVEASRIQGILIRNPKTGHEYRSPPHRLKKLEPGVYTLRVSGDKVKDPDYQLIWDVMDPAEKVGPKGMRRQTNK